MKRPSSLKLKNTVLVILLIAAVTFASTVIILLIKDREVMKSESKFTFLTDESLSLADINLETESDIDDTIHIGSVCGGFNATKQFYVLLKSILFYRSNKIHLHLLVDEVSKRILTEIFANWKVDDLEVNYYNLTQYESQVSWISSPHYSRRYGLVKLVFPSILATQKNINKVIMIDVDMLMLGNINYIWTQFPTNKSKSVFGMVENQSDWYLGDIRLAGTHSIWPSLNRGFNSGLILIDLKKLVQIDWAQMWRQLAELQLTTSLYATLADQDVFNAIFKIFPDIVHTLPCHVNLQLNEHTNITRSCPHNQQFELIHWNSPNKLSSNNRGAKFYRTWYQSFKNWSGKLLETGLCCKQNLQHPIGLTDTNDHICDNFRPRPSDPLRIFPFYFDYEIDFLDNDVTLAVHSSIERLPVFNQLMSHWTGPVSAAIYLPEPEIDSFEEFIQSSDILYRRKNIAFHLVFRDEGLNYPINRLRNIALKQVQTPYVFLSDVDFLPSYNLHSYLRQAIAELKQSKSVDPLEKRALVIAAYENSEYKFNFPTSKTELLNQINIGSITPFREQLWPQGQAPTDYKKWRTATKAYKVEWKPDYEPFIVTGKDVHKFDERFGGFGWNKVEHTTLLAAEGYEFLISPEAFLIHKFHPASYDIMKHRESVKYRSCIRSLKKTFLIELKKNYPTFFSHFTKNNPVSSTEVNDE